MKIHPIIKIKFLFSLFGDQVWWGIAFLGGGVEVEVANHTQTCSITLACHPALQGFQRLGGTKDVGGTVAKEINICKLSTFQTTHYLE